MAEQKIRLIRPERQSQTPGNAARYRAVACCASGKNRNAYRLILSDSGRWEIECEECGAEMELSDLLELGNAS